MPFPTFVRLFPLLAIAVSSCASAVVPGFADGGTDGPDAPNSTDGSSPCPPTVTSGDTCSVPPSLVCSQPSTCAPCGFGLYARYAPACTCTNGRWDCGALDCTPSDRNVFIDGTCTTRAGADAGGVSCGGVTCAPAEFCYVERAGVQDASGPVGECRPSPPDCQGSVSCACFTCPAAYRCVDNGPNQILCEGV